MASFDIGEFEARASKAEALVEQITRDVARLREQAEAKELQRLNEENKLLKADILKAKDELRAAESANGKLQVPLPGETPAQPKSEPNKTKQPTESKNEAKPSGNSDPKPEKPKAEKKKKAKKEGKAKAAPAASTVVDVSRIDFRVGKIVKAEMHPDAESLYLETIDAGEEKPRTVISGLANYVPLEEMQNRMVVLCCNLKPRKMRGVLSEAMVMCCKDGDKLEVLVPPEGAVPGDVVEFEGYERNPDAVLNPKKKIFEAVQPDLRTNDDCVATYQGVPFMIKGKGPVKSQSLKNTPIS